MYLECNQDNQKLYLQPELRNLHKIGYHFRSEELYNPLKLLRQLNTNILAKKTKNTLADG